MVTVGDLLLGPLPPHFLGICGKSETLENVRTGHSLPPFFLLLPVTDTSYTFTGAYDLTK